MTSFADLRVILGRLWRYGAVGLAVNFAGYVVYLTITWLGAEPKSTMSLLYGFGAIMGYFGHRRLAFQYGGSVLGSALRYSVAHISGYALNFAMLFVLVDRFGYPHQAVQAVAIFVTAGFLFLCFNFLVFPRDRTIQGN